MRATLERPRRLTRLEHQVRRHEPATVTIGDIVGGGLIVRAVCWFVYLRRRPPERAPDAAR